MSLLFTTLSGFPEFLVSGGRFLFKIFHITRKFKLTDTQQGFATHTHGVLFSMHWSCLDLGKHLSFSTWFSCASLSQRTETLNSWLSKQGSTREACYISVWMGFAPCIFILLVKQGGVIKDKRSEEHRSQGSFWCCYHVFSYLLPYLCYCIFGDNLFCSFLILYFGCLFVF